MKYLSLTIYIVAALQLAMGTGEFALVQFSTPGGAYTFEAWRNAAAAVVCIEALFVWLVGMAKSGRLHPAWSIPPLLLTGGIQIAKVTATGSSALGYVLAVASVGALAAVVYLGELRDGRAPVTPQSINVTNNIALVVEPLHARLDALQTALIDVTQKTPVGALAGQNDQMSILDAISGVHASFTAKLEAMEARLPAAGGAIRIKAKQETN